jgi:hypothetical protein
MLLFAFAFAVPALIALLAVRKRLLFQARAMMNTARKLLKQSKVLALTLRLSAKMNLKRANV